MLLHCYVVVTLSAKSNLVFLEKIIDRRVAEVVSDSFVGGRGAQNKSVSYYAII